MGELTNTTNSTTAPTTMARFAALKQYAASNNIAMHMFTKFDGKMAVYTARENGSQETVEIPLGTEVAVNINEIKRGFVCWKDRKQQASKMVNIWTEPKVTEKDLPDLGLEFRNDENVREGWTEQMQIPMKNLKTGEEYLFQASSKSAMNQMDLFIAKLGKHMVMHDLDAEAPVVALNRAFFVNKKSNDKVYYPKLDIKSWAKLTDIGFTKPRERSAGSEDAANDAAAGSGASAIRRDEAQDAEVVD